MTQATRVLSTPPTSTPIPDDPIRAATVALDEDRDFLRALEMADRGERPLATLSDLGVSKTREYLIEGVALTFIVLSAGIAGCMIAMAIDGKLAAHCAATFRVPQ